MHQKTRLQPRKTVRSSGLLRKQSVAQSATKHPLSGLQQSIGNRAVQRFVQSHYIQAKLTVGSPGDQFEQEADRMAQRVMRSAASGTPTSTTPRISRLPKEPEQANGDHGFEADHKLETDLSSSGSGRPLSSDVRAFMEPQFGADLSHVRVHTGSNAMQMNKGLHAEAFTHGSNIYFGSGKSPGKDPLTAHELTHVIQQTGGQRTQSVSSPAGNRIGTKCIQRSLTGTFPVTHGGFEVDMQTRNGAVNTPPTDSGLDGYIRFIPNRTAPNSNSIVIIQVNATTDAHGADLNAASMPAAQAPRGALGQPGLRTQADPARGIEGGFKTDVHHRPNATAPGVPRGTALSPRYNFQPAPAGALNTTGQTAGPRGGTGGVVGQTPGFKRSNNLADIRSASMYDRPGVNSTSLDVNWSFETAALGEDTMITYGAVKWGFGVHAGRVVNERISVQDATSATFGEALERHRDFYVHEPVTFYFPFNSAVLSATEAAKIDTFMAYLGRNPDVHLSLDGFADIRGGASQYNRDLSLRRAEAVETALLARGIAAARIEPIVIGFGASSAATTDAGTGDMGGSAAVGADQTREANRWANRRVVLTFTHVAPAPAPTPAPAPGAPTPGGSGP